MIEKLILRRTRGSTRDHEYCVYHKTPRFREQGNELHCRDDYVEVYQPGNNYVAGARTCDIPLGPGEFAWFQVCYFENDRRYQNDRDEDWIEIDLTGNCVGGILNAFDVPHEDCSAGGYTECPECGHEVEGDVDDHSNCYYDHCEGGISSEWLDWTIWIKKISPTFKWPVTREEAELIVKHVSLGDPEQEELKI